MHAQSGGTGCFKYINARAVPVEQDNIAEVKAVGRVMELMTPEHREILVLVCVKGLKYDEAAEVLGMPVGTIRSRLNRARLQLAELMNGTPRGPSF